MPARRVMRHDVHLAVDLDAGRVHRREKQRRLGVLGGSVARHDDGEAGADRPGDVPFATADQIVVAVARRIGRQLARIGAGPVRLGHHEAGPRTLAQRLEELFALIGIRHHVEKMLIAFVRRRAVKRQRAEHGITRRLEGDRAPAMRQVLAAIVGWGVRREDAMVSRLGHQAFAQIVGDGLPGRAPGRLLGKADLGHEGADLGAERAVRFVGVLCASRVWRGRCRMRVHGGLRCVRTGRRAARHGP